MNFILLVSSLLIHVSFSFVVLSDSSSNSLVSSCKALTCRWIKFDLLTDKMVSAVERDKYF